MRAYGTVFLPSNLAYLIFSVPQQFYTLGKSADDSRIHAPYAVV
jgi:hypothetical protein